MVFIRKWVKNEAINGFKVKRARNEAKMVSMFKLIKTKF